MPVPDPIAAAPLTASSLEAFPTFCRVRMLCAAGPVDAEDAAGRALVDAAPVLIWSSAVSRGLEYVNLAWLEFTGRAMADEQGDGWLCGVHTDDRELVRIAYRQAATAAAPLEVEYRLRNRHGQYRWMLAKSVPRFADDGTLAGMVGGCVDVTEHRQACLELERLLDASDQAHVNLAEQTRRLHQLADTDPLTGLLNRRGFREHFERELARSARYGRALACIVLDIDFFKRINDTHGHAAGDATLVRIADIISRQCRPSDVVCRYGGEEFCVMLPETSELGAAVLAERMRVSLEDSLIVAAGQALRVTSSFGVADRLGEADTVEDLVERADQALRAAKRLGRNQVVRFQCDEALRPWGVELGQSVGHHQPGSR
jgi:diguanylate cyclase (GGDEF)-like protein/PAS domain S-box-containing protein